jgi:hypothetical protein
MKSKFHWLLVAPSCGAAFFLGLYFAHFHDGFSVRSEEWAQFGEYVGGAFAMLAFIGVLITVAMQHEQLELQRDQNRQVFRQAAADELHRISRDIASNIEQILEDTKGYSFNVSVQQSLAQGGQPGNLRGLLKVASSSSPNQWPVFKAAMSQKMNLLEPELNLLARCAREAEKQGGATVIVDYYRDRYNETVEQIERIGLDLPSMSFWRGSSEASR